MPPPLEDSHHDFNARREIDYYYHDTEKQELIRNSPALKDHRTEIAMFFDTHPDAEERGDFIKGFYDGAPVEMMLSNDQLAGYHAYDDVLHLWRGEYQSREREVHMRWSSVAQTIYGMMLLQEWLSPEEQPLPSTDVQISLIQEEAVPATEFVLPQEAIDYVLCSGSSFYQGKLRIYAQFQKGESSAENVKFIKNVYGTGGHSDAIPGTGFWEDHDAKGIKITERYSAQGGEPERTVLLKWPAVEKRIRELIAADRYLSEAEKAAYPAYEAERDVRNERSQIAEQFNTIIREYKVFVEQLGEQDDLSENEIAQLKSIDKYFENSHVFDVHGLPVVVIGDLLAKALSELSKEKREIILLSYFLDLSDREIGERTHAIQQTVSKRRHGILKELRTILEKEGYVWLEELH